jgi:hypothetical protein
MQIRKRVKNGVAYQQPSTEFIDGMGGIMNEGDLKVGVLG